MDSLTKATTSADRAAALRAFNRFYTNVIGVLEEGLLRTTHTLTEARVIYELGQAAETDVADLRRTLAVDRGYLSRILSRFEGTGLVVRSRSESDRRRQVIRLSDAGRAVYATLDGRSAADAEALLGQLDEGGQRRLIAAMTTIAGVLGDAPRRRTVLVRGLRPGDLGWVIQRHGELYAREYGWDATFEALVARIAADFAERNDPACERAWIAEVDGTPAACLFCVRRDDTTAQLRLLLVEPRARGLGIGARLVAECLAFARGAGYDRIMLWTQDCLEPARRIYEAMGFTLERQAPHHSFGHDLVEQYWSHPLIEAAPEPAGRG